MVAPFRSGQFVCEFYANLLNQEEYKDEYRKEGRTIYTLEVILVTVKLWLLT